MGTVNYYQARWGVGDVIWFQKSGWCPREQRFLPDLRIITDGRILTVEARVWGEYIREPWEPARPELVVVAIRQARREVRTTIERAHL